jgi:hypothetical protein
MSNPSKQKGTAAETAVVRYARTAGFPLADRLTLSGAYDRGDVSLTIGVIVEVKAGGQAKTASKGQIEAWLEETERERVNARADIALLVKQRTGFGTARVDQWDAWFLRGSDLAECAADALIFNYPFAVSLEHALRMLRARGWGDPIEVPDVD